MSPNTRNLLLSLLLCPAMGMAAADDLDIQAQATATATGSSGEFAPYYISSLNQGRTSSRWNAEAEGKVWRELDLTPRFSWAFGVDLAAGYTSAARYERYSPSDGWTTHGVHPSRAWVQQLYGEVKYRGVFLRVGQKDESSALLTQELTSGDLVESGNARPIPQARAGFVDFQNVPFTRGWLQIQGEIGFGPMTDDGWIKDQYNYYDNHIAQNQWYNYKRCYFRIVPPTRRWQVTLGMQAAAMFGGDTYVYRKGELVDRRHRSVSVGDFFKMWLPTQGGDDGYYEGNHLGSWDFRADYRLKCGSTVSAYFQWPWEDGSGIGRVNGWDGVWGLEWKAPTESTLPLTGVVVEYLDFTSHSGPLFFSDTDYPGTTIHGHATGGDSYYNNGTMGPYTNYGMGIGTPALMAPMFNLDGFPGYLGNRMRGFHIAAQGQATRTLGWRVKGGYRRAWGTYRITLPKPMDLTAVMAEATWQPDSRKGLWIKGMVELDRGDMPSNAFGALLTVGYKL